MMDTERREEGKITEKVNLGTTMKVKLPCFLGQKQPVLPGLNLYCKGFEVSKRWRCLMGDGDREM